MAVESYLSWCIPDLRGGNDIGKNRSVPNPFIYIRDFGTRIAFNQYVRLRYFRFPSVEHASLQQECFVCQCR